MSGKCGVHAWRQPLTTDKLVGRWYVRCALRDDFVCLCGSIPLQTTAVYPKTFWILSPYLTLINIHQSALWLCDGELLGSVDLCLHSQGCELTEALSDEKAQQVFSRAPYHYRRQCLPCLRCIVGGLRQEGPSNIARRPFSSTEVISIARRLSLMCRACVRAHACVCVWLKLCMRREPMGQRPQIFLIKAIKKSSLFSAYVPVREHLGLRQTRASIFPMYQEQNKKKLELSPFFGMIHTKTWKGLNPWMLSLTPQWIKTE